MTTPRRLRAAGATLALLAAATCSTVWGDSSGRPPRKLDSLAGAIRTPHDAGDLSAADSGGRFAKQPVVTYQTLQADLLFAWQLQPQLPASGPARPRDIAVVIDTSASQVGHPLRRARSVAEELAKAARPGDRLSLWTLNTPEMTRSLTGGFQDPQGDRVHEALDYLATKEYAAGATDLKAGLTKVLRDFPGSATRQQVVLYLGDGESHLNPLADADRAALAAEMASREIGFFPVPLGPQLDPTNLHGLASATGGAVVRLQGEETAAKFLPRLEAAFAAPVFYPNRAPKFAPEVAEALPTRLPPLRGDAPTLVAGLLKPGAATVGLTVDGVVAGRKVTVEAKAAVPAADATNYFLVSLVHQWKHADRTAPALVRADRGLALAYEQTRLAREEVLTQAHWALSQNQLDAAAKLFEAARKFDPRDPEPATGLKVVAKLKDGQITREQIRQQLSDPSQVGVRIANGNVVRDQLAKLVQEQPVPPPPTPGATPPAPPAPPPAASDLLDLERRRRQVQEQQVTQIVDDTIARARQLINSDPEAAYDLLKRQLTSVRENTDLSDRVRATLANRLESQLRWAVAEGARVKQQQEFALQQRIAEQARREAEAARRSDEESIRERIRAFGALMNQARYEEAYKEALVLQQEQISKGRPVPVSATAAYQIALNDANLREFQELVRVKEDRFLLTMLQVDRSHVPFPDEPPVAFPPAATWRELTNYRKDKYEAVGLEGNASRKALRVRDKLNQPVSIDKPIENAPLRDVLDFLSDKYDLTFIIDSQAFDQDRGDRNVEDKMVRLPKMPGVSLGTILRFLLAQVQGTYLIRRDYIEITTTDASIREKAVRAYPVADLVIPIPNSVNQNVLQQNLQVLGGSLSANGMAIFGVGSVFGGAALGFQGALGALGVLGPLGALGAAGAAIGGVAGIGGAGGGVGFGGVVGGQAQGVVGFAGGGGNTINMGFGGGVLGFGGGQQGQFGNLGGQFGLQGGNTSGLLIELIKDVIAPKEWNDRAARYLLQSFNLNPDQEEQPILNPDLLNSLGFYQPAQALVVRGTSRIHTRIGGGPIGPGRAGGGGMGAANKPGGDVIVIKPGDKRNRGDGAPAAAKAGPPKGDPQVQEKVADLLGGLRQAQGPATKPDPAAAAKAPRDANKVWNDAMDQGLFKPRQVIAVADVLAIGEKFDEVVALLKADLRKGVLAQPCVFEALALALKNSGGSPQEIERVRLSVIDLDPQNPNSYLAAAEAMNDLGQPERALAFCKRAAALQPNSSDPYAKGLVYLAKAHDVDTDAVQWAAGNLLRREWSVDRQLLQAQAQQALAEAVTRLRAGGHSADADRVQAAIDRERQRDLVVQMLCENADLDLEVTEPTGGVCSSKQPQSIGGGVWRGDHLLAQDRAEKFSESYVAAEAFTGSYEIRVRTAWGKPLGGKVTLRVTKHQGAPEQAVEQHVLELSTDGTAYLKIHLEGGRRTDLAAVPPPAPRPSDGRARAANPDRVYDLLRAMAEPAYSGMTKQGMVGGTSAGGPMANQVLDVTPDLGVELVHQNRLATADALQTGAEIMGRAVISPDRREVTMSLAPVFQTASDLPQVKLSPIPGGN
jgi:hypothetical protein